MRAYDLHVHTTPFGGENSTEDTIDFAKRLGWSGIALCCLWGSEETLKQQNDLINKLKSKDFDIVKGVEIKPENPEELYNIVDRIRKKVELIVVRGGETEINKAALDMREVDMLAHPENQRNDSGIDLVLARAAADNQVLIELNFREILNSSRKTRVHILAHMRQNLRLAEKYGFPVAITSGAYSKWELRAPRELAAFGFNLGMQLEKSIQSFEPARVDLNRQKLDNNWIMPGVKVIENG